MILALERADTVLAQTHRQELDWEHWSAVVWLAAPWHTHYKPPAGAHSTAPETVSLCGGEGTFSWSSQVQVLFVEGLWGFSVNVMGWTCIKGWG